MVRRPLSFWIFLLRQYRGQPHGRMPAILISIRLNVAQPGAKPRVRCAAARRRAATIGDGLICSSTQTTSIALRFLDAVLIETELFVNTLNHIPERYDQSSEVIIHAEAHHVRRETRRD